MLTTNKIIEIALESVPLNHKVAVGQTLIKIADTVENTGSGHGAFVEAIACYDFDLAKRKTNSVYDSSYLHLYKAFRQALI